MLPSRLPSHVCLGREWLEHFGSQLGQGRAGGVRPWEREEKGPRVRQWGVPASSWPGAQPQHHGASLGSG